MYEDIKTAALYVRYSSTNQTEQSIEGQTRVCTEFAKRYGIEIVEIYADRALSASKDIEKRTDFLRMIRDSETNKFDAVIVYKLDRFSRSRYDMANYKFKLKKNGVRLISATEQISQDPEGIILESVLEGMAEFYSAELSQKINRGLKESAYKHTSIGGHVPLGYKQINKKLVIDEETAPIVREAFQLFAEGKTIAQICRIFNAKGYRTSKGTKFGRSSFSKMFRNEKYIGTYSFHDYKAENAIPAIIDKDLFQIVQNKLQDPKEPGSYKAKRIYLLSGKLFCGHCGSHMNGDAGGHAKFSYYQCYGRKNANQNCKKKAVRKNIIEAAVTQDALEMLTDENIETIADVAVRANNRELEQTTEIPQIKAKLTETKTGIENITHAIETGIVPDTLVKRLLELEKEQKYLEYQLKEAEKEIVYLDKPKIIHWLESFRNGDIEDEKFKQTLIDLFVNSVTVWDDPDPDNDKNTGLKITIAYNLTMNKKTYRLEDGTIGFRPQTTRLEVESDKMILLHSIRIQDIKKFKPRL